MPTDDAPQRTKDNAHIRAGILKRGRQLAISNLVTAAALFFSAGTFRWPNAWVYLAVSVTGVVVNVLILLRVNPDIIAERAQIRPETKGWDRRLIRLMLLLNLVIYLVAGLDRRLGWSQAAPLWLPVAGLILLILGSALASWAMIVNPYFATTVCIQADRGHRVISRGPYRFMRHPGYCGWILSYLATPLLLIALWAYIPAVLLAAGFVLRAALEDRTLLAELDGYQAYAERVPYRLMPGLW